MSDDLVLKYWNSFGVAPLVISTNGARKMKPRKYSPEKTIRKLREAEMLISQGIDATEAWRQIGVSSQTFYRGRKKFGGIRVDQAKRLS